MRQWQNLENTIVACRKCSRLVVWREEVARTRRRAYKDWVYWGKPVPGFGDQKGRVLVVGLAPGAHGANRTGRMFTGDGSGDFLFRALHRSGFASQPVSTHPGDGLSLSDLYISAVCRCAPPGNKPTAQEIENCRPYLEAEIGWMENLQVIVALGQIAFAAIIRLYRQQGIFLGKLEFNHGAVYKSQEDLPWLVVSYHPSRQNTQTGRLSETMFDEIWSEVKGLLG